VTKVRDYSLPGGCGWQTNGAQPCDPPIP